MIGIGASPRLSNLLAKLAWERLEQVDDLYTAGAGPGVPSRGSPRDLT